MSLKLRTTGYQIIRQRCFRWKGPWRDQANQVGTKWSFVCIMKRTDISLTVLSLLLSGSLLHERTKVLRSSRPAYRFVVKRNLHLELIRLVMEKKEKGNQCGRAWGWYMSRLQRQAQHEKRPLKQLFMPRRYVSVSDWSAFQKFLDPWLRYIEPANENQFAQVFFPYYEYCCVPCITVTFFYFCSRQRRSFDL